MKIAIFRRESVNLKVSPSYFSFFFRLVSSRCASAIKVQGSAGVVYVLPDSRMLKADPHVVHKILFCIQTLFRSNQYWNSLCILFLYRGP